MEHKCRHRRTRTKIGVLGAIATAVCFWILLLALLLHQPPRGIAQKNAPENITPLADVDIQLDVETARHNLLLESSIDSVHNQDQRASSDWSVTNSWVSGGPYGGAIRELVISPNYDDGPIFAGMWGGGVYRKDLDWSEWYPINIDLPNGLIRALVISPDYDNDETLFVAGFEWGVYKTTNGGNSWQPSWDVAETMNVKALAISPVYSTDQVVYAGTADYGIYRSDDGGQTWTAINTGLNNLNILQIVFAPDFDFTGRVYALTDGTVHRSDDGFTWTPLESCPGDANELTIELTPDGNTLFVGTDSTGVYSTTATGSSWVPANVGISDSRIDDVAISPNHVADRTMWATDSYADKVYRSTDGALLWSEVTSDLIAPGNPKGISPYVLAVSPEYADDATLFVGSKWHGGVYRSRSSGDQWRPFANGLSWWTLDIALSPSYAVDETVFAGVNGGGILKSTNRGASWQMASQGYCGDGFAVALSPGFADDKTLFTGGWETGIYHSTDGGASWQQSGLDDETIKSLAISPGSTLADSEILAGTSSGLYRSTDEGTSWNVITQGLPISNVYVIAFSPACATDQTIFLGGGCTSPTKGVFRSVDGGDSWTYLEEGPDGRVYALALSPDFENDQTVFASIYGSVYESTNAGDTWNVTSLTATYVTDIAFSPNYAVDDTVWAATSQNGVYVSADAGETWTPANNHLEDLRSEAIAVSPPRAGGVSDVFVGTLSMGVWQMYQDVDLIVRAHGTIASSEWPSMEVRFNDEVVATWIVSTTEYTLWMTDTDVTGQDKVDVAFLNNGGEVGPDELRDLYVDFVQVGDVEVSSLNEPSTMIDRNVNSLVYYDGLDSIPAIPALYWGAAMRFLVGMTPEESSPPGPGLQRVITDTYIDDAFNWPIKRAAHLDANPQGQALMAWYDERNYDWWGDIYAQWIASDGTLVGANIMVNDEGSGNESQYDPAVLVADDGSAIIVWADSRNNYDIFAQRFDSNGDLLGANFSITDHSLDRTYTHPDIDGAGDGSFVVVWNQYCEGKVFARWYDQAGAPITGVVQVTKEVAGTPERGRPKVAISNSGRTLVVWYDKRNGDFDIYGQWYTDDGIPSGGNFRLNDDAGSAEQLTPDVAVSDEGFIAVWRDYRLDNEDIYAQRFDVEGNLVGSNLRVNDDVNTTRQHAPRVGCDDEGYCAVTWWDRREVVPDIYAQIYDMEGVPYGMNFRVNSGPSDSNQFDPVVAWDEQDRFWIAWSDNREEVCCTRIYANNWLVDKGSPSDGDDYEPDDNCAQANAITIDGVPQYHTFHQEADKDWVQFTGEAGTTYVIETANVGPDADTVLALFDTCGQPPLAEDDNAFGSTARIVWPCSADGTYYVEVSNDDPYDYGPDAYYDLSVRAQIPVGAAIIVAGHNDTWALQDNIDFCSNTAYWSFMLGEVSEDKIYYLNPRPGFQDPDGDGVYDDVDDVSTVANVQYALETWAPNQLEAGDQLFVYLMDHGAIDKFATDGNSDITTPQMLDTWLHTVEDATGCVVNVIIEACHSGSFIDGIPVLVEEISEPGRVIIASTGREQNAYASSQGAYFSDAFWTSVQNGNKLWEAFQDAAAAVEATGLSQTPWLDDNGNTIPNDTTDGQVASGRGLIPPAFVWPPVVEAVTVTLTSGTEGVIQAQVWDDSEVQSVWAILVPPSFQEPPPGEEFEWPELDLPEIELLGNEGLYQRTYNNFDEAGLYRVVVFARDDEGNQATPVVTLVRTGYTAYLPLIFK